VSCGIGGQPVLEVGVVGADEDGGVFLVKIDFGVFSCLVSPVLIGLSFLRLCHAIGLGGLYDTVPGSRDLYFRVSGANFDWLPLIRAFAEAHAAEANTVTVLWDRESTGHNEYLADEAGHQPDLL